jgi:hypothetical protein
MKNEIKINFLKVAFIGLFFSSLLCAIEELQNYEKHIFSQKHNDHYNQLSKPDERKLPIEKINCNNLKWDTSVTPFQDAVQEEIKKKDINYDKAFAKFKQTLGVCPKNEIQLLILTGLALDLEEHAKNNSKKWQFPISKQQGLKLYDSIVINEYWMNINTLEKLTSEKKNWNQLLSLEKTPVGEYLKKIDVSDKFFDLSLTKQALLDYSILKLRFLEGKITSKEISKNATSKIQEFCSRDKILKINEALDAKKEVPMALLDNIYGHIYFYFLNMNFCKSYKFSMMEEYLDQLNSLLN